MKKCRFTEEQIALALKHDDVGQPVADVCRQIGISKATCWNWKPAAGPMWVLELASARLSDSRTRAELGRVAAHSPSPP